MLITLLGILHYFFARPSSSISKLGSTKANITSKMSNTERTFIMIKPDGVHRGLLGDIIKRFEQKGFKLVAMKFTQVGWSLGVPNCMELHS
jgi:hypothetical protein